MRAFLILVLVIALMAFAGWLTFQQSGNSASVTVETGKIERDARLAVRQGAEALDQAAERIKEGTANEGSIHPGGSTGP